MILVDKKSQDNIFLKQINLKKGHPMQKEWTSFRITLLLYFLVLLLPFSFYFVSTSFKTIQEDTKIVRKSSWLAGAIGHDINKKGVDTTLQNILLWAEKNNDSKLYIGAQSLKKDLTAVTSCLSTNSPQCYTLADTMALNIEKMVYLKQKKIINIFYISLALAMILLLLMIYLVRVYIHRQMKKHSIHDHETHLFNKKYFLSELHSTFDRSVRHENPLSLISVTLNGLTNKSYDKKTKAALMKTIGDLFTSVTRNSDITARYSEEKITVLLPLTDEAQARILEDRIKEALDNHNFEVEPRIDFSFVTTEAKVDEPEEAFITRCL